jgi:hypothetical protein
MRGRIARAAGCVLVAAASIGALCNFIERVWHDQ